MKSSRKPYCYFDFKLRIYKKFLQAALLATPKNFKGHEFDKPILTKENFE